METHKKELFENYHLEVSQASLEEKDYFLAQCESSLKGEALDFILFKKEKKKAWITVFIFEETKKAISLPEAPFGGIWLESSLNSEQLEFFLNLVLDELRLRGVQQIEITQAPKPYEENHDLIDYLLFKMGFQPIRILAHQFFLGKKKIKKFIQKEESKFHKKIKDSKIQVYQGPIQNFGFLKNIQLWNEERGYEVSLDEVKLINQVSGFPERYFLISLEKEGYIFAHTLAVRLTENSLYYFQSAINPKSSIKNSGEILLFQLFKLAGDLGVELIDLGSSDRPDSPNHSLMFFKSRFSNDISNKVTWVRKL
ncbi:hypothetical protein [Algoriphagus limi]|uniref:Acetyltransferase (GNAT) domain-containing protein n=1 Tax=Algoriphagus limi TaxID=2975273 RepID=A0ABT2G850_9BACT|nr:hypothetical protein [Algoriphagus limi]MCS5490117.1 hypothetical protein [Algoriphagus limi]